MKIIVIDDNLDEALRLKDYAQDAFSDATVLPEEGSNSETFPDWSSAVTYLRQISDEFAVLFLDLALKSGELDYNDVRRGLEQGVTIRSLKRHWVIIAYTRFADYAVTDLGYQEAFDGIISKGKVDSLIGNEKRVSYVKRTINNAIRKRKRNLRPDLLLHARIVDSFGIRTFQAAFGEAAIAEIIENEAPQWSHREVEALTTGHSGAFMLSLRGRTARGNHSLVIKVAQNEQIIQHEIQAQREYFTQLGPLNSHLGYLDPEKKDLLTTLGVYYRQAFVDGDQLLELLRGNKWQHNKKVLGPIVDLCVEVCRKAEPHDSTSLARDLFKLTPTDIGRLESSLDFIVELGSTLHASGFWPSLDATPRTMANQIVDLAKSWTENTLTDIALCTVVQHGDVNPGNVLISRAPKGDAVLIDLARLGHWHIGYDLSRLALMLRLRLIDTEGQRDWLPQQLVNWVGESIAAVDQAPDIDGQLCPEAAYCDYQFQAHLQTLPLDLQRKLAYGYRLGTLWDLIKVISYQDLSPYKRIWALIEAWKLMKVLSRYSARDSRNPESS
jgi:hypothetical protein